MLAGWRDQQLARNLNSSTIHNRDADVRRFQRFTNDYGERDKVWEFTLCPALCISHRMA